MIFFLTYINEEQIVLFLVKRLNAIQRILINDKSKPDWQDLEKFASDTQGENR